MPSLGTSICCRCGLKKKKKKKKESDCSGLGPWVTAKLQIRPSARCIRLKNPALLQPRYRSQVWLGRPRDFHMLRVLKKEKRGGEGRGGGRKQVRRKPLRIFSSVLSCFRNRVPGNSNNLPSNKLISNKHQFYVDNSNNIPYFFNSKCNR